MNDLETNAKTLGLDERVRRQDSYESLITNVRDGLNSTPIFMLSLPHGNVVDEVIEILRTHLSKGAIILDFGNEHYKSTERRERDLKPQGIHYVGCGISGGYQSARAGPSFSPGGDPAILELVMPLLRHLAAKDNRGMPCTTQIGPGGSGHYFKMIHNGIEQGMMSILAEAWFLLAHGLGLSFQDVATVFRSWNEEGPLRSCFLVGIGSDVAKAQYHYGDSVLATVRDKVVQDVDESEGTGVWTCQEAVSLHVPATTILAAHLFRCASADAARRAAVCKVMATGGDLPQPNRINGVDQHAFIDALRSTTYFGFLSCFAQGLSVLRERDCERGWNINYRSVLQTWRGGCIIQADHVLDILEKMYSSNEADIDNIYANPDVAMELLQCASSTKQVVLRAVEADLPIPAISQSLEHFKYIGSTQLPTQFMEAELDYFGKHMYDTWHEPPGGPKKGSHHYEWKPATGRLDKN